MRRACDYIAVNILARRTDQQQQLELSEQASWYGAEVGAKCNAGEARQPEGRPVNFSSATEADINRALDPLLDSKETAGYSKEIAHEELSCLPQFSYSFLETITNNFSSVPYSEGGNKIGAGAFGAVYYGRLSGQLGGIESVVVKKLSRKAPKIDQQFNNEVEMMSLVDHPNILKLLAFSMMARSCACCILSWPTAASQTG